MSTDGVKLFLDVDGVLNVFGKDKIDKWGDYAEDSVEVFGDTFLMTISRKCCDRLASLPVDIQWLTTWGHEANNLLSHMTGFDRYPVFAEMPPRRDMNWKYKAVKDWYRSDKGQERFVWIDDDAIPYRAEDVFPHALLIRTSYELGITPEHIDLIRAYCER